MLSSDHKDAKLTRLFNQLRDIWVSKLSQGDQVIRVEVLSWLCRATLDIIGIAGKPQSYLPLL